VISFEWTRTNGKLFGAIALAFVLAFAAQASAEPANLGDVKIALKDYVKSGQYEKDLAAVGREAIAALDGPAVKMPRAALVLDIDETSLSNLPQMLANDFGYVAAGPCAHLPKGPCGARAWELSARAQAVAPTLELFRDARDKQVAVFFITGRDETERTATTRNLIRAGYRGWTKLIMRPAHGPKLTAADYKAAARAGIEAKGYRIIVNVGDQPSDLAGGHAEKTVLLPNPFYRIP